MTGVWLIEERGHRDHPWRWDPTTGAHKFRYLALREVRQKREASPLWFFRATRYVPAKTTRGTR